jgi:hypothetical protein
MNLSRKDKEVMMHKMRELALNNPDKIVIVETNVDPEIQLEFFDFLEKIKEDQIYNTDINQIKDELYSQNINIARKKEILVLLARYGEVESFRLIENYLNEDISELKTWTYLAFQQAKMFLESKLLEETKIYIASGMGGNEHRLRYAFALKSNNDEFNDYQKKTIEGEIKYFFNKNDCILEDIYYSDNYAIATCLVPVFNDLIELLQNIISEINQLGNFVQPNVFITNEKPINIDDLKNNLKLEK